MATDELGRVPDILLERFLAEDLPRSTHRLVETKLQDSEELRQRLQTLRAERDAYLQTHPPAELARNVCAAVAAHDERQDADRGAGSVLSFRRGRRSYLAWILGPSAAAATMAALAVALVQKTGDHAPLAALQAPTEQRDEARQQKSAPPSAIAEVSEAMPEPSAGFSPIAPQSPGLRAARPRKTGPATPTRSRYGGPGSAEDAAPLEASPHPLRAKSEPTVPHADDRSDRRAARSRRIKRAAKAEAPAPPAPAQRLPHADALALRESMARGGLGTAPAGGSRERGGAGLGRAAIARRSGVSKARQSSPAPARAVPRTTRKPTSRMDYATPAPSQRPRPPTARQEALEPAAEPEVAAAVVRDEQALSSPAHNEPGAVTTPGRVQVSLVAEQHGATPRSLAPRDVVQATERLTVRLRAEAPGELAVIVAMVTRAQGPARVRQRHRRIADAAGGTVQVEAPIGHLQAGTRVRVYVVYRSGGLSGHAIAQAIERMRSVPPILPDRLAVEGTQHLFVLDVPP